MCVLLSVCVVMNLIAAIERIPPSDLVSDELDLLLKRTQRGFVVLEQVGALTDRQVDGSIHTTLHYTTLHYTNGYACIYDKILHGSSASSSFH